MAAQWFLLAVGGEGGQVAGPETAGVGVLALGGAPSRKVLEGPLVALGFLRPGQSLSGCAGGQLAS